MYLIGLDIGTTGCKASLFSVDGKLIMKASREYGILVPQPGWAEQDSEEVWELAQSCIMEVVNRSKAYGEVLAIGLSVQGEAVIPIDQYGQALRPAILGMDTRTGEENHWLEDRFGRRELFCRTGMPIHTINTLPKLLWLKNHEKDIWREAHRFVLYEDYLINKMTGTPAVSHCLASRTQLYDLKKGGWSEEILSEIELDSSRLSPIFDSGTPIASLKPELAETWGLKNRPVIVTGGHDQACGALGVGLVRPGISMVSTGTAEVIEVALQEPALGESLEKGNISCYVHPLKGLYLAMTLNHSGGLLLRWYRDTFCLDQKKEAESRGVDAYDLIFGDLPESPSPLILLPHFAGSGTPWMDTNSKGAILGLTFSTTQKDFALAILEGLTYELNLNIEVLRSGGVNISELRAIGGGARSKRWLQLKADVTGIPVLVPKVTEAASWGAALLAGKGSGIFPDLAGVAATTVQLTERYSPNAQQQKVHSCRYSIYKELYPLLISLNRQLSFKAS
jgi:xylulokinase